MCLLKTTLLSANQIQEIIILLTSVTVFFGSHLVRNHESQSRTTESQLPKKKPRIAKLKVHEPLCNQTVNLETDAKTLYYSLLKLKYSPSIYLKHKKD